MHIQINLSRNSFGFLGEDILPAIELWKKTNPDCLLLTYGDEIDLNADLNIEVINTNQIKVGFLSVDDGYTVLTNLPKVELHWLTISEWISYETVMLIKFLTFLVGLIKTPSQMGTYVVDFLDLKKVMEFGNDATLMSFEDDNTDCQVKLFRPLSSSMLLNGQSSMNKKLSLADGLIPQNGDDENYLGILNITEADFLPRSNMVLFINNTVIKTNH